MKTHRLLLLTVLLVPWSAQAQLSEVPERISYQGIITDANGTPIGDTDPENRNVTLRVWDHPTAAAEANLVYSEQQVATIANGEFSFLVGAGADVTGTPLGFSETTYGPGTVNIADVFDGMARYLGVTVDDGTPGTVDPEISPRQQIVTSPFSFRAREAETVINSGIVTGAIGDQQVTLSKMAASSVDSTKIVDSSIATDDLAGAAVTLDKMAAGSVDLSKLVAAVQQALCPAGSILAFAGPSENIPGGWLPCDGRALDKDADEGKYLALYTAIATAWGNGTSGAGSSAETEFNLPDLRGMFLRGADSHGTQQNADGNPFAGSIVGTYQQDQFQGHQHDWEFKYGGEQGDGGVSYGDHWNNAWTTNAHAAARNYVIEPMKTGVGEETYGTPRVENETKPASYSVLYIIKY